MADTTDTTTSGATTSGSHTGTGGESQNTPDQRAYAQDTAGVGTQNQGDGTFDVTPTVEQLAWGDLKLSVSENGVMGLNDGFSTAIKVNTETNDDKEGRPATNTQTIELQEISFDFLLNAYFLPKTTIEKEWEKWKKQIAKHHPLYLNGKQFGPKERTASWTTTAGSWWHTSPSSLESGRRKKRSRKRPLPRSQKARTSQKERLAKVRSPALRALDLVSRQRRRRRNDEERKL